MDIKSIRGGNRRQATIHFGPDSLPLMPVADRYVRSFVRPRPFDGLKVAAGDHEPREGNHELKRYTLPGGVRSYVRQNAAHGSCL